MTAPLPAPRPAVLALLGAVTLAGAGIGAYLVWHHDNALYGDANLELGNCPTTETINCEAVNSSEYSELFGVPLAGWGIATWLLLLGAAVAAVRRPRVLGPAFAIALLTVLFSGYLFYVSKVKVGFLCLWCLRLYGVNLATAVLIPLAARRSPLSLLRDAFADLRGWPMETRALAGGFVVLVALTIGGERAYRASLTRLAKKQAEVAAASKPAPIAMPEKLPPLQKLVKGVGPSRIQPFDLTAELGHGKPLAVLFWAPGIAVSESALLEVAAFMRTQAPSMPFYALTGWGKEARVDALIESWAMLGAPTETPLLLDEKFAFTLTFSVSEVPTLLLFDASGKLLSTSLKSLRQVVFSGGQRLTVADLVRSLASGSSPSLDKAAPYYPASELYGACAPPFRLPEFESGKDFQFTGKSPRGKPTLVLFWSSTCKHCQKEIPQLVANYKAHPGAYDVVSVTSIKKDRPGGPSHRTITADYIASTGIPWTVLDDADGAVADRYKVVSTPTTLLVAPNGEVIDGWYYVHPDLDAALEKDLAKLNARTGTCQPPPAEPAAKLDLKMTSAEGSEVALSTLTDRPTLVHFWATWCAPCLKELPAFLDFKKSVEADGARVVLVSVEDEASGPTIEKFQKEHGFDFQSHRNPHGGVADAVEFAYTVPRTYLLGPGGTVLSERFGDQPWADPDFARKVRTRLQLPVR